MSDTHFRQNDSGLPPSVVLDWLLKRWLPIVLGVVVGVAGALAYHLAADDRFTARMDFAIPESPLGSPTFVQKISTSFLERQLGANVAVSSNPQGTITMLSTDLNREEASSRLARMQEALAALQDFLTTETAQRYEIIRQDFRANPENASVYTLMNHFRTYVDAQEAGLFDQIGIQREDIASTKLPLLNRVLLGLIGGCALGVFAAAAIDLLAGRRRDAAS